MNSAQQTEQIPAGWVTGNFDGFCGTRIYPAWSGELNGKRLTCRDIRVQAGQFFIHNPWNNTVVATLGTEISAVENYIMQHGRVIEPGANVWD
jgi:hypothetical protein